MVGVNVQPSPGPRHKIRRVLAAHTVIKPAPQVPTNSGSSTISSIPAPRTDTSRQDYVRLPVAQASRLAGRVPAWVLLLLPHTAQLLSRFPSQAAVAAHGGYFLPLRVWGLHDESKRILGDSTISPRQLDSS